MRLKNRIEEVRLENKYEDLIYKLESVDENKFYTKHDVHDTLRKIGQHFHTETRNFVKLKDEHKSKLLANGKFTPEAKGHIKKLNDLIDSRYSTIDGLDHIEDGIASSSSHDRTKLVGGIIDIKNLLSNNSDEFQKTCKKIETIHNGKVAPMVPKSLPPKPKDYTQPLSPKQE